MWSTPGVSSTVTSAAPAAAAQGESPTANDFTTNPVPSPGPVTTVSPSPSGAFTAYVNARYQFSALRPAGWDLQESANGDGATITSPDRDVEIVIFGSNNLGVSCETEGAALDLPRTLAQCYSAEERNRRAEGSSITYQAKGNDWFVLSGHRSGGQVYYQRSVIGAGSIVTAILTYPQDKTKAMDEITTTVSLSLRAKGTDEPH